MNVKVKLHYRKIKSLNHKIMSKSASEIKKIKKIISVRGFHAQTAPMNFTEKIAEAYIIRK